MPLCCSNRTPPFPKEAEGITSRNFLTRRGHPASLSRNPPALTIHLAWSEARLVRLYLNFDVIAFDHDFVTWNALLRWRPQDGARFQIEIRAVQGAGDLGAMNGAFRQRSATVRATVANGIISSLDIEEGDSLALDCERSRLARWHVPGCRYFDELCHNA